MKRPAEAMWSRSPGACGPSIWGPKRDRVEPGPLGGDDRRLEAAVGER